jgi:peptidoglycan/LPS O-acetylase OafA/YrhL
MTGNDHYLPSLTGFRAIAAWLVFANHYNPFAAQRFPFLNALVNELNIGVSMFFVLSGFLITIRYDDPFLPRVGFGQYMRNRFARIYPLYFILTTLTFIGIGEWDWVYVANITLTKGFFDDLKFTGIAQAWSLTVEETFYFLAPFLFLTIRRYKASGWLWPFILLGIGVIIFRSFDFMLVYTFFGRSLEFFIGIGLAKIYQQKKDIVIRGFTWIGILMLSICLAALVYTQSLIIHQVAVPIATALLLWGLITEETWLQKLLSTNFMQLLGKSSYAFYLIHIGVIALLISDNPLILFIALNTLAIALYYTVERPLQKAITRL